MENKIYGNPLLNNITRIDRTKVQEVIVTECIKGAGTPQDPIIAYQQYWTREGVFIGEITRY